MSYRTHLLVPTVALIAGFSSTPASACWLTDWLYGRREAVPLAPTTPYVSGYPAYSGGAAPYTAGYTPVLPRRAARRAPLPLSPSSTAIDTSDYSVQRPAYGAAPSTTWDNPSVYTGMPVASRYRGLATSSDSFYGTGNVYPNTYGSANSYRVARPAASGAVPATSLRRAARPYRTPIRSGLARFFGSLLGTGYRSSYYNAPITYYRPATTVDPTTGTTVTVQRACESEVQQLQRTPVTRFQPSADGFAGPTYPQPAYDEPACGLEGSHSYPLSQAHAEDGAPMTYGNAAPYGDVRQTGDWEPVGPPRLTPDSSVSNAPYEEEIIPNQPAPRSPAAAPSRQPVPLTGAQGGPASPSDRNRVGQPRIESSRENLDSPRYEDAERYEEAEPAPRFEYRYEDQSADPPSYYRESREAGDSTDSFQRSRYQQRQVMHELRPIPAPDGYRNPFDSQPPAESRNYAERNSTQQSQPSSSDQQQLTAKTKTDRLRSERTRAPASLPPLPQPVTHSAGSRSSHSHPPRDRAVRVREASAERHRPPRESSTQPEPLKKQQESGWYSLDK